MGVSRMHREVLSMDEMTLEILYWASLVDPLHTQTKILCRASPVKKSRMYSSINSLGICYMIGDYGYGIKSV